MHLHLVLFSRPVTGEANFVLDVRREDEVEHFGKLAHATHVPLHLALLQLTTGNRALSPPLPGRLLRAELNRRAHGGNGCCGSGVRLPGHMSEPFAAVLSNSKPVVCACRTNRRSRFATQCLLDFGVADVKFIDKGACGCSQIPSNEMQCYPSYEVGEPVPEPNRL
jgi:rhodanese-related sulfurtransferase